MFDCRLQNPTGWLPSKNRVDFSWLGSGTEYTAPANGYIYFSGTSGSSATYIQSIVGTLYANIYWTPSNSNGFAFLIPIPKGEKVSIYCSPYLGSVTNLCFIYAEGEI